MPPPHHRKGANHSNEKWRNAKIKKAIVSWIRRTSACVRERAKSKWFKRRAVIAILLVALVYGLWLSGKWIAKLKRRAKCVGSDILSDWTPTPLYDRRYFAQHERVSDFMEGPALTKPHKSAAICKFREITFWYHFPHAMQQLYRCSSWWFANPSKTPVLLFKKSNEFYSKPFIRGFLEVLEKRIGLKVVRSYSGPYVTAKDTQKWELDIEVTDFAMYDPQRQLRKEFATYILGKDEPPCHSKRDRFPRIAILNRNDKSQRKLNNANKIAVAIAAAFPRQIKKVPIVYFEGKSFLEQVRFFLETDIVISPHGAQLTALAFLPPCAALLEFFPKQYLVADYFGSLARSVNISHSFFYLADGFDNPEIVMPYEKYHYYITADFRSMNQCPAVGNVTSAVIQMVKNWELCCATTAPIDSKSDLVPPALSSVSSIDILAVDAPSSTKLSGPPMSTTQAKFLGSHRMVRNFFSSASDWEDSDVSCSMENFASSLLHSDCSFMTGDTKPKESLCMEKRLLKGLYRVLDNYRNGNVPIPDYLLIVQNDTYVNMNALIGTLRTSYSPGVPRLLAGCTNVLEPGRNHLVFPVSGFGSILSRGAIKRMVQPISCNNDAKQSDHFVRWACWRLEQNYTGEHLFFENGMSISDLMFVYFSDLLDLPAERWNHTGYCFHRSDHAIAYFLNYYHVSVPDWVLKAPLPADKVRKQFSYRKLTGSTEVGHSGIGGECDNVLRNCTYKSRFCHPLNVNDMVQLQRKFTKKV